MPAPSIICISHGEDADGITCCALVKRLKKAYPILVTYDDFEGALKNVSVGVDELFICDLNIREELVEEILRIRDFSEITIIDHHPTTEKTLNRLKKSGVEVIHDTQDCASVLLYDKFREKLGRQAGRMAAFAAWADQFEDGPLALNLLRKYDRQSVQHEGLLLAHALTSNHDWKFKLHVLEEISRFVFPHRIEGVIEAAIAYLEYTARLIETLPEKAVRLGALAYFEGNDETPIGAVAGLITDALGVEVGLCYKTGPERVNVSVRGRRGITYHLGETTRDIASRHEGFGGGHKRASGASIPLDKIREFILDLNDEISSIKC